MKMRSRQHGPVLHNPGVEMVTKAVFVVEADISSGRIDPMAPRPERIYFHHRKGGLERWVDQNSYQRMKNKRTRPMVTQEVTRKQMKMMK